MQEWQNLWDKISQMGPLMKIALSLGVIIVGWLICCAFSEVIQRFLKKIKVNQVLKEQGWEEFLSKAGISLNLPKFFGEIAKWCLFVVFLLLACDILELSGLRDFLEKILDYIPNIIVAGAIFIVAVFLADFSFKVVTASLERARITYAYLFGKGVQIGIWIFAILAILLQLGIARDLIKAVIYGVVGMIALACGIAFGLGGKEIAKEILEEIKEKMK